MVKNAREYFSYKDEYDGAMGVNDDEEPRI